MEKEENFYWFIFGDKENAEDLSNQYWQKEAQVNAKDYAEAIRSLKDRLYARK